MVLDDFPDPATVIVKGIAVSRQHRLNLEPADALERKDVVVERIGSGLWMQADIRADLRQQVVAGKEDTAGRPVETAVSRGMPRGPDELDIGGVDRQAVAACVQ